MVHEPVTLCVAFVANIIQGWTNSGKASPLKLSMLQVEKHRLWFLDYENDFPHSTSAPLALLVSTFFDLRYAELCKLKLELHTVLVTCPITQSSSV